MTVARVGVVLDRVECRGDASDRIRLAGMLGPTTWVAETLAGFGPTIAVEANDLIADYGVTEIDVPPTEIEVLIAQDVAATRIGLQALARPLPTADVS
ncbi:MAG: hypothetical protein JWQ20_2679 [Conexibacter sp.]|nr:hypothetical protein [Conexibacter sp.]